MATKDNININITVNQPTAPAVAVDPCAYNFGDQPIRIVIIDGEPWFVAADVCQALEIQNTFQALARLDEDERGQVKDAANSNSLLNIVNESGLYVLVMTSRKPEAKKFRKWITSEVLPSIRKTGSYTAPKPAVERISATQMNHLACVMATLEENFHVPRPASHAAYVALRKSFGVESTIQNLPATQFNNALAMTLAMGKAAFAFKCMVMDVEKKFVREVIRNGNGFDRASYEADFDEGIAKIAATRQQQLARGMAA